MPTESVDIKRQTEKHVIVACAAKLSHCADDSKRIPNPAHAGKSIRDRVVEFWIEMGQLNR